MFCRNCGKEIENGRFCPFCGASCDSEAGKRQQEQSRNLDVTIKLPEEAPVYNVRQTVEKETKPKMEHRGEPLTEQDGAVRNTGKGAKVAACILGVFLILSLGGTGILGFILIRLYDQNQYLEQIIQSYAYLEEEAYEKAIQACAEAIELVPERKVAYLLSAEASMGQKQIEPAIAVLEQGAAVEGMDKAVEERLDELKTLQEDVPTLEDLGVTEEDLSEYALSVENSMNQVVEQELQEQYASDKVISAGLLEWEEMLKVIGDYQDATFQKVEMDWRGVHILLKINGSKGEGTLELLLNKELYLEEINAKASE